MRAAGTCLGPLDRRRLRLLHHVAVAGDRRRPDGLHALVFHGEADLMQVMVTAAKAFVECLEDPDLL